jgi:predicted CXXCH cytochrome family protein
MSKTLIRAALAGAATMLMLWVTVITVGGQAPPRKEKPHLPIRPGQECTTCHEKHNPMVVKLWKASKHAEAVSCATCHGAVGPEFSRKPTSDRCEPCHFQEVAQLTVPIMQGKTCFTCHHPHALSPHKAAAEKSEVGHANH